MIIHINSYAGVGKLTIARALAERIGAKVLDNHSVYNVGFALTEFRSAEFYETVRAVRDVAFERILKLPHGMPVILTNWYSADSEWSRENWDAVIALARRRQAALNVVVLSCSVEENARRIQSEGRESAGKLRDPAMVAANRDGRRLLDHGGDRLLRLDVSSLSAAEAADRIAGWLAEQP